MSEQFSDDLKKEIKTGFVVVDERTHTAIVMANQTPLPDTGFGIIALMRKTLGLRSELTMKHGYTVL